MMQNPEDTPPDPETSAPLPARVPRSGNRWTKRKMAEFLRMLASTHSVAGAARSVGMTRQSAYRLRSRLKGEPFDIAWEAAFQHGYDALAHAALERALHGVEVPHYYKGELVGTSRKYDERLTCFLLAARNANGAQMLGRYTAAGEFWSERWDRLLERVEFGPVEWEFDPAETGEPDDESAIVRNLRERHGPDPARPGRYNGVRGW